MSIGANWTEITIAFARIVSFLFLVPILENRAIPKTAKLVMATGLSLAVAGHVDGVNIQSTMDFVTILIMEILIGITLAKIVEMLISIPMIAGSIMDLEMGFMISGMFDPTVQRNTTLLGKMMNIMFILLFVYFDGIRNFILTVIRSFELTSTLQFLGKEEFLDFVLMTFTYMLSSAVQIALPVMGAMLIVNVVLIIIGKTAPQTQIFINMFPIKIGAGLLFLAVAIPIMGDVFSYLNEKIVEEYLSAFNYLFKK